MKDISQKFFKVKTSILKKDRLLILLLTGILMLVIGWPVPESEKNDSSSGKSVLWDSEYDVIEREEQLTQGNAGEEEMDAAFQMEQRLEALLSSMDGVGEVKVMITLASSSEQIIEKDSPVSRSSMTEADSAGGSRSSQEVDSGESTVYVTGDNGEKIPYVVKEISPRVEGVSVVAAGGGNAYVQKNIIEVIQALFGIEIHKIKVVKMK